jgi:hypothetical protein
MSEMFEKEAARLRNNYEQLQNTRPSVPAGPPKPPPKPTIKSALEENDLLLNQLRAGLYELHVVLRPVLGMPLNMTVVSGSKPFDAGAGAEAKPENLRTRLEYQGNTLRAALEVLASIYQGLEL